MMQHKLLGFFVVFSIMAMGISVAYADISVHQDNTPEEKMFLELRSAGEWVSYTIGMGLTYLSHPLVEAAWGFEYKEPFESQKNGCTVVTDEDDRKRWECYGEWLSGDYKEEGEERTPNEDGCTSGMDIDIRTGECKPFEQINEEARAQCNTDPECPSGYYNPTIVDPQMPDEDSERVTDQELIKKINALIPEVNCYQGRGTTDGVQAVRDFPIPVQKVQKFVDGVKVETYELDLSTPSSAIQIRGYYATIVKAAFECHAQNTLQNDQGGVLSSQDYQFGFCDRYAESLTVEQSILAGCGMTSGSYYTSLHKDVPIMTQAMANEKANFGIEKPAFRDENNFICRGNYSEALQKAYGCPEKDIVYEHFAKPTTMKDYSETTDNPAGAAYEQYLIDGGEKQAEKIIKSNIQKKIANLMDEIRKLRDSQK